MQCVSSLLCPKKVKEEIEKLETRPVILLIVCGKVIVVVHLLFWVVFCIESQYTQSRNLDTYFRNWQSLSPNYTNLKNFN